MKSVDFIECMTGRSSVRRRGLVAVVRIAESKSGNETVFTVSAEDISCLS